MPGKNSPEFSYDEKTKLYRKRIKNDEGRWVPVYGKTKQELREKIKIRQSEFEQRLLLRDNPLCYEYAIKWFELWSAGKGEKNLESIRSSINNYIMPVIGNMRIIDITESNLLEVLANCTDKSKSMNAKIVRTMKMMFRSAEKEGLIKVNPAIDLKPGGIKPKEKVALTQEQQDTLLTAMEGTSIYSFIMVALYSGLRREEVLALQWDCIFLDDEHPYIAVRRALRWDSNKPVVSDVLKSDAASRDIPIPPELCNYLQKRKASSIGNYVFGDTAPLTRCSFYRAWSAVTVRTAGTHNTKDKDGIVKEVKYKVGDKIQNHKVVISLDFHVTPHILRHTYITRLILAGVNIKVVQYLAGHASVDITLNIYTHLMENRPKDTADAVLSAFNSNT